MDPTEVARQIVERIDSVLGQIEESGLDSIKYQKSFGASTVQVGGIPQPIPHEVPNPDYDDHDKPVAVKITGDVRTGGDLGPAGNLGNTYGVMIGQFPIYEFEDDPVDVEPEQTDEELTVDGEPINIEDDELVNILLEGNPLVVSTSGDHIWGIQCFWDHYLHEIPKRELEKTPDIK